MSMLLATELRSRSLSYTVKLLDQDPVNVWLRSVSTPLSITKLVCSDIISL